MPDCDEFIFFSFGMQAGFWVGIATFAFVCWLDDRSRFDAPPEDHDIDM